MKTPTKLFLFITTILSTVTIHSSHAFSLDSSSIIATRRGDSPCSSNSRSSYIYNNERIGLATTQLNVFSNTKQQQEEQESSSSSPTSLLEMKNLTSISNKFMTSTFLVLIMTFFVPTANIEYFHAHAASSSTAVAAAATKDPIIWRSGKEPIIPGKKPRDKNDTTGTRKDGEFLRSIANCKNQCENTYGPDGYARSKEECLSDCQDICCKTYEQCTFAIVPRI